MTTTVPARSVWIRAAVATLLLWCVTMVLVVVATPVVAHGPTVPIAAAEGFAGLEPPDPDAAGVELLRTGLVRQDALWYLAIAADGYPTTTEPPPAAAFLPAYPAGVAGLGALLGGDLVLAAQLLALLACVAAFAGLQRLAWSLLGDDVARGTLVAAAVFPTSFFLVAPYAESLFLAASVWSLVEAVRGRSWRAAAFAALATLTRPVGVLLAVPLLLGVAGRAGDRPPLRERIVATGGIGVAGVGLLLFGWWSWGDPLAVVTAQSVWQRRFVLFPTTLFDGARFGLRALVDGSTPYHLLDLLVLVVTICTLGAMWRRRQEPLVAHGVVSVVLWTSSVFDGRPLMSTPRFALGVPAVLLGMAVLARGERLGRVLVPVSAVLFAVHAVLFTRWLHVF